MGVALLVEQYDECVQNSEKNCCQVEQWIPRLMLNGGLSIALGP